MAEPFPVSPFDIQGQNLDPAQGVPTGVPASGAANPLGAQPPVDPALIQQMLSAAQSEAPTPPSGVQSEPTRKIVDLSPDQKRRLAHLCRGYYDEAMRNYDNQESQRLYRYRRYLADPTLRNGLQPWPDAPKLFLPMTRSTIESLKTNLGAELFGNVDKVTATPVGKEDREGAKRAQSFFRWWLEDVVDIRGLSSDVLLDAMIDSLGIVKVYPHHNPYPPLHDDAVHFQTEPRMDAADLGLMLIPPDATGLQFPDARYIGQRLFVHPDTLIDMAQRGYQTPDLTNVQTGAAALDEKDWTEDERKWAEFQRVGIDPQPDVHEPTLEMVEFYVLFAPEPGQQREFFVVHWMPRVRGQVGMEGSNGLIMRVVRLEDAIPQAGFSKPAWPFFEIKLWAQPRQLHGMDVPTRLESMQDILNRQAEQMIQDGDVNIVPFYFYNAALTGDLPDLTQIRPGAGIPIDNAGQVHFPPRSSNNRHYAEQMQFADSWAEKDSNVTALSTGRATQQPNAPRTLGGQQLLLEQSNKAFSEQTQSLADQWRPALKMAYGIWQNRLPDSVEIPMPDTEGLEERLLDGSETPLVMQKITHDDLSGLFDIRLKVDPEAFLKQQRQLALAEKLDPIIGPVWPLGRRELWRQIWEMMKLSDFDKVWPEKVATIQTQILIMQAEIQLATLEAQVQAVNQPQPPGQAAQLSGAVSGGGGQPSSSPSTPTTNNAQIAPGNQPPRGER